MKIPIGPTPKAGENQMAGQGKSKVRREEILKAAQEVFAKKGFQEATVSDVAQLAGVSDTTIYEYFSTKEDLLFSIPMETSLKAMELESFLHYIRGSSNKLRAIIYHYLQFYQNNPDYASVVMLILKQNRNFLQTETYQIIRKGFRIILDVIEEGIATGEFQKDTDPLLVRHVLLGSIEHLVIRKLLLGKPEDLLKQVDPLTDLIIDGIRQEGKPRSLHLQINLNPSPPLPSP
jgi:TetR/AcrR family transcriptional regulator, fatty acid metabolism regulator protein